MKRELWIEVLESLREYAERFDAEDVDVLVRVGDQKLLRLHGLYCGNCLHNQKNVFVVFRAEARDKPSGIQWDGIVDLHGAGEESVGWQVGDRKA